MRGVSYGYYISRMSFQFEKYQNWEWYPYVSLFPDLLCKFGLSVSSLRKIRFNAYTPRQISTKISSQTTQDSRCPH